MKSYVKIFALFLLLTSLFSLNYQRARPKVYDCFTFFNELDLLTLRLEEMHKHVDKFVIVESRQTFQGKEKQLFLQDNFKQFEKFKNQIIHVVVDDWIETDNPWERETFQRNQIMRGLVECKDHDVILISDVDEIVRPAAIPKLVQPIVRRTRDFVGTTQRMYSFYLNRFEDLWHGTVATSYRHLKGKSPQEMRDRRNKGWHIEEAGWHFTYVGGVQQVIKKIEAFSHSEGNTEEGKNPKSIQAFMEQGLFEDIDETFPIHLQKNQAFYRKKGFLN